MRIDGRWVICDDDVVRPMLYGSALSAAGTWKSIRFLLDPGADRTVFSAAALADLGALTSAAATKSLGGVGGLAEAVTVDTQIRFADQDGKIVLFRGPFHAVTRVESLDLCVLGRDVTNHFAIIIDRPGDFVFLIAQRHRYKIEVG
jgi:hypothetical protein